MTSGFKGLQELEPAIQRSQSAAILVHGFLGGILERVLLNERIPTEEVEAGKMALELLKQESSSAMDRLDEQYLLAGKPESTKV